MHLPLRTLVFSLALAHGGALLAQEPAALDAAAVKSTIQRVADWQLANPNGTEIRDWVIAPLYDGLIATSETTGDPKYLAAVLAFGIQAGWTPGNRFYMADEHAVGHAWLDIYLMDPSHPERLKPMKDRFDGILAKPITEKLVGGQPPKTPGVEVTDRWTWCDALFMGPPTLARLAKATGDSRYLDFMDQEYRVTYDALFDESEGLFFRDARFLNQKTPNGEKVFWSRGNGWVFAGFGMLIDVLPADHPTRKFYIELFQKMAPAIAAAQQPDGLWYPSLKDPKQIAIGETSGSAFFVYGLAWGINHGFLDREKYLPVIERGWKAILSHIEPDGAVGFVQRIGDAPDHLTAESRQLYGTGGVLMAGSEILRLLGAASKVPAADLLKEAGKLVAADKSPRAYARFVPERQDDLAWENDLCVYRVYGPALRSGTESSGIDAWAKSVRFPVINHWYADDLAGRQTYHEDHGQGYDGYKVGDSRGVGGVGIWKDGKLVVADVYDDAGVIWTKPDVAEFTTRYTFPAIDGTVYHQKNTTRLRMGERLNEITARFTLDKEGKLPAKDLDIAIGLIAQTPKAEIVLNSDQGTLAIWDRLQPGNEPFGIAALVPPGSQMLQQPHEGTPKFEHALAIVRTDANGEIHYRAGFGWAGNGIPSKEAWLASLSARKE